MFKDVGETLKVLAKIIAVLGIIVASIAIVALIGEILYLFDIDNPIILVIPITIGLSFIFASIPIYAFGQITNDVKDIKNKLIDDSQEKNNDYSDLPSL